MSGRVKDLLDQAVAGIEPRDPDPVGVVIRRGRNRRAAAVVATAVAMVAVLAGGAVAGTALKEGPPPDTAVTKAAPKPATRPDRPPVPRLEKGRIAAGDMSVAVPDGWQVMPVESAPCGHQHQTVVFGEGGNPWGPSIYCGTSEIEVLSTFNVFPSIWTMTGKAPEAPDAWQQTPADPYRMVTLEGGAAAWLRTDPDGAYRVVLPWSRVEVMIRGGADVRQRILDSLETGRWAPRALVLPTATEYAGLIGHFGTNGLSRVEVEDPAKVRRALEILGAATPVAQGESCAREDQPTVALEIGKSPVNPNLPEDMGSLVISLAPGCHEVVSEEGGRGRLDVDSLTELGELFQVELP
ncbi:hypothetical protein [Phytohabitans houttuyneae]|uniref:Uncharacterized protein n=1 Tax=Phytohabitans houttuyneae TaxID=1076126 RepID=A0A6V8KJD7_9ACTN|nr:hypothetical protein [Phytohabitans houttuyneae]GFJ85302.1 hypothetical protein Phou_094820 [Phytohabitans houttuyneae]